MYKCRLREWFYGIEKMQLKIFNPESVISYNISMKTSHASHLKIFSFFIPAAFILFLLTSCEKEKMPFKDPVYVFETDSMIDIEGNVYKTVKIGDHWWMAENLKVKHYRNNVLIHINSLMSDDAWANYKKGSMCYYNSIVQYSGPLYNWYAVTDTNGIAPEGWRIPTDNDWKKLEQFLGMHPDTSNLIGWRGTHTGEKLKARENKNMAWSIVANVHNTNESGFSALPGSCRLQNGSWGDPGIYYTGFWWSSSETDNNLAFYRYLDYQYSGIFRYFGPKSCAFSIRCVKDEYEN